MADRIKTDFRSLSKNDLWLRGCAVAQALDGNPKYPDPPVSALDLRSQADDLHAWIVMAMDGSRTARTTRDSLSAQLISTLKLIVPYVEKNCGGDLSDSGFEWYTPTRKAPQPVATPKFRWIESRPKSHLFQLMIAAVDGARGYEVEVTPLKDEVPGASTIVTVMNVKSAYTLSDVTPQTKYMFRVRALGAVNRSDWSSPITEVCG